MISHFFIDRPIFARCWSIVLVIVGVVAYSQLPSRSTRKSPRRPSSVGHLPGGQRAVVADTVAFPIEQEVNGVENMLYMSSKCHQRRQMYSTSPSRWHRPEHAQCSCRTACRSPRASCPRSQSVRVTTKKKSPSILLCVNLISPGGQQDQLYLSNFATTQSRRHARLKGRRRDLPWPARLQHAHLARPEKVARST